MNAGACGYMLTSGGAALEDVGGITAERAAVLSGPKQEYPPFKAIIVSVPAIITAAKSAPQLSGCVLFTRL